MTYLVDHPTDYRGAFARLRRELRMLYFSAFQSHLWNLMLGRLDRSRRRGPTSWSRSSSRSGLSRSHAGCSRSRSRRSDGSALPLALCPNAGPRRAAWARSSSEVLAAFQLAWTDLRIKHLKDVFFSKGLRACLLLPEQSAEPRPTDDELHPGARACACRSSCRRARMPRSWSSGSPTPRMAAMNLDVLFEDNHCLAVNKPAGLLSQGDELGDPSLVDLATRYLKAPVPQAGERLRRARCTGSIVRRRASFCWPRPARRPAGCPPSFAQGTISKVYWAIVEGDPGERRRGMDRSAREGSTHEPIADVVGAMRKRVEQGGAGRLPRAGAMGAIRPSWSCGRRRGEAISSACSSRAEGCRSSVIGNMVRRAGSRRWMAGSGSRCMRGD